MANLIAVDNVFSYLRATAGTAVVVRVKWGSPVGSPQFYVDGVLAHTGPATPLQTDFTLTLPNGAAQGLIGNGERDIHVVAGSETSNTVHVSFI